MWPNGNMEIRWQIMNIQSVNSQYLAKDCQINWTQNSLNKRWKIQAATWTSQPERTRHNWSSSVHQPACSVGCSVACLFVWSLVCSVTRLFSHSFVQSLVCSVTCFFGHSFLWSLVRSANRSLLHLFTCEQMVSVFFWWTLLALGNSPPNTPSP